MAMMESMPSVRDLLPKYFFVYIFCNVYNKCVGAVSRSAQAIATNAILALLLYILYKYNTIVSVIETRIH